jgi:hypothetical protein
VAVRVALPVPVIVTGYVPAGVAVVVAMVRADEELEVTEAGPNEAVAPPGRLDAVSATDCAEPDVVAVLTVAVADEPGATLPEAGETATEKSFAGVPPVQVASPVCAGTLTAFHAALTVSNSVQLGVYRFFAAFRVAVRMFACRHVEVFDCMAL